MTYDLRVENNQIILLSYSNLSADTTKWLKNIGMTRRNGTQSRKWYMPYSVDALRRIACWTGYPVSNTIPDSVIERFLTKPPCVADYLVVLETSDEEFYAFVSYVEGQLIDYKAMGLDKDIDGMGMVSFWGKTYKVFHSLNRPKG
jgi:hypothetical protein